MGTIRIEAVPVQSYNLGLFRFDHLQLVYQDETDPIDSQDYWFVIEGIQDGPLLTATLGASGDDGHTSLAVANGASREDLVAKIGTPESRGSRIIVSGPDAQSAWNAMADYAGSIEDQNFPYIAYALPFSTTPTINSTSLIATLLWSIGLDINNLMPFNIRLSPGPETILGTPQGDDIKIQGNFTTLAGGEGDDVLGGSTNTLYVEKLYGGSGDDTFNWSYGENIIHGGQPRMAYANDGVDTIDYSGVGAVHIVANRHPVDHKVAEYVSAFSGGSDQLFSIEQVAWDAQNDSVTAGPGVDLLEKPLELDLKGSSGGHGDELGMSDGNTPLLVNVVSSDIISVQAEANAGLDAGYWVRSLEWFVGSNADDKIYAGGSLLGVDGGNGDDVLDARLTDAFAGQSPLGYDIELYGGAGDNTIVSGEGRTFAQGGDGSDSFVLSAMTNGNGTVEFVIDGADASDKLYVPYDFFKVSRGVYEGSELFQLTGGVFKIDDVIDPSPFFWGDPDDDQVQGNIEFVGDISYAKDGDDLVITLLQGHSETEITDNGPGEPPGPSVVVSVAELQTETTIRIHQWSEGVLGLVFPLTWDLDVFAEAGSFADYPGWHTAIANATASDKFIDPLDDRPDSHLPKELGQTVATLARALAPPVTDGTDGDDTISANEGGPYQISGLGGSDTISGSDGGDTIDGGSGADIMAGGLGNDVYYVDDFDDVVVENAGGGFDKVISAIDYALGTFVEHIALAGSARNATGNALRNTLEGNAFDNLLNGQDGDDTLAGNGGDDTLVGGNGGDGYVYELGDGRDTIIENAATIGDDVIILAGNIGPDDVSLVRNPDTPADLQFRFPDGGSLTVKDYFATAITPIEGVEFTSGAVWSKAELAARAVSAIVARNTAPTAVNDYYTYSGDGTVTIPVAALLDNDSDVDADILTVTSLSDIQGGTASLDGLGNVTISGTGHVRFNYVIDDGNGGNARAAFDVSMIGTSASPNHAPIITSSAFNAVSEDQAASGRIDASDADGNALIYAVKAGAGPSKGSVIFGNDGTFTYTPHADANGEDSFTLTVTDGFGAPVEQRFAFFIAALNDAPVAHVDGPFVVQRGEKLRLPAADLLGNDTDVDGDQMSITSVTGAKGGTVVLKADGSVTFNPLANYAEPASFNYSISDGHGGFSTAIVDLVISNTAPVAQADIGFQVFAGKTLKLSPVAMLRNDTDADCDRISIASVSSVSGGTVALNAGGGVSFKAQTGFIGPASFNYTISDGHGGTSTSTVSIDVLNNSPIARPDHGFQVEAGQTLKLTAASLLQNDRDADGHNLSIVSVSSIRGGTVTQNADGSVSFEALSNFLGQASFKYEIVDGHDGVSTTAVTLHVTEPPKNKIVGTSDRDILSGTAGNDVFIGKADHDIFVFRPGNGHDQINDFQTGNDLHGPIDVVDLRGNGLTSYLDLVQHIQASGDDTLISLDDGGSIRIKDVHPDMLSFDCFQIL